MEEEPENGGGDEDDEKFYNPLKLPLGWDGKPIPFWLYKLHGLGIEYPCEICGNFVYMGRKAFERHFQEWRHAYGMRCLGITNTLQFQEVTKIADALARKSINSMFSYPLYTYSLIVWKKIQQDQSKREFKSEEMEEFEDQQGNVFNKKTYEDLRRQGLL